MDVERQLAQITPQEFDRIVAYERIEPDPPERLREIIKLGICLLARCWGAEIEPKQIDPWHEEADTDVITDANQMVALLKQTIGVDKCRRSATL